MYIAHKTDDGKVQSVAEHLCETAKLAKKFAVEPFDSIAEKTALFHDIGKYSEKFQKRINGENIAVEHSICGAKECKKLWEKQIFVLLMEYCIAGHHSGLPDGGSDADLDKTLSGRLNRLCEDYSAYQNDIMPIYPETDALEKIMMSERNRTNAIELYAFFTKYIFSCLTDADFIDTERFCNDNIERGLSGDFEEALRRVNEKLNSFDANTPVRKARARLLSQASENSAKSSSQIDILNMPTGSGKTLCSLKIALEKAVRDKKDRIIYVIPYTSIIEQTARVFSDVLGDSVEILQHHSNYCFEDEEENLSVAQKLRRTCENWDAPIVVTTSVQFFQSLYHYKGSRLRKLHNIANSVIIFDEIHMLPIEYLQPCLRAVGYVTKYLKSNAIFLSATMPDYSELFEKFLPDIKISNIITDKSDFSAFRVCRYNWLDKTSFEAICEKADSYESSLIIVNTRKFAQKVYNMLGGKKYHLSTYMTPEHRSRVIAEIKECLKNHEKISVVSTSLVEAGVDFDFHAVFRQLAGLDNMLQAGGRCNREGLRPYGEVFVFETDEVSRGMELRANVARSIFGEYSDIMDNKCTEDYYNRLFGADMDKIVLNSISTYGGKKVNLSTIPFRSYANSFKLIEDDSTGIVINNNDECARCIESLRFNPAGAMRKLQKYTVSVRKYEYDNIIKLGITENIDGVCVLNAPKYYNDKLGLYIDGACDSDFVV